MQVNNQKLEDHIKAQLPGYDPLFIKLLVPIMIKLAAGTILNQICLGNFDNPSLQPYIKNLGYTQKDLERIRDNRQACEIMSVEYVTLSTLIFDVPEVLEIIQKNLAGLSVEFSNHKQRPAIS